MSNESWWEKHREQVQLGLDVLFVIISPWATWKLTNNLYLTIASIIFGPLLIHSIVNMIEFNVMYPKMRYHIHSVLGSLKEVALFLDDAHQLDSGKRGLSLSFAIKSLNSLTQKGFLEVDVPFPEFLDYIKALSRETNTKIFGTSTIRRPKEFALNTFNKNYLRILLTNHQRRLVRVTVLDDENAMNIVKEALKNLRAGSRLSPAKLINDIPEIEWWVTWANEIPYIDIMRPNIQPAGIRILLWTTHSIAIRERDDNHLVESTLRPGTIDDYAVFDDSVVVKFRENRDVEKGILFLLWGGARVQQYIVSLQRIDMALERGSNLTLRDLGLFSSFHELLVNMPHLTIDISSYQIIRSYFRSTIVSLHEVYAKIIDLVNNGSAIFTSDYTDLFSL